MSATTAGSGELELDIGGMTCASCANRIERKLNKVPGVEATVNYATEKARIHSDAALDASELIAVVESAGYTASLPAPSRNAGVGPDGGVTAAEDPASAEAARLL
jgi:P-type Cu+ transporter